MKRINRRVTLVSNFLLLLVLIVVFSVSFFPERIVPIYGGKQFSAIYNGNRENKKVSLMFNVYENTEIVNQIVQTLDDHGVKATFFVGGCWADDNAQTLLKIVSSGHELANHGYFHKDHKKLDYERNKQEIELTGTVVKALSGSELKLFAPPSGSYSDLTLEAAFDLGYKVIMWSKDTIDWRDSDQNVIYTRATKNPENGDLILMHPKEHTLKTLDKIIEFYKNLGYQVVTVSENLS